MAGGRREVGGAREVGGRWEVGGGGGGRWEVAGRSEGGTEPDQAHHRRKPQAMLTVPNRTVTPMF